MTADKKRHDALDQSRDVIAIQAHAADGQLTISQSDRQILRRLAGTVAELAARPVEEEKQKLWARHNALEWTRPMVFCDPENGWKEIIPPDQIECENQLARQWEMHLSLIHI